MDIHNLYKAETEQIDNGKGYWEYTDVKIRNTETDEVVYEYTRNYHTLFRTFFPFEQNGNHYALISDHYTRSKVIDLKLGETVAEEQANAYGFCPVEFYVPRYWTVTERISKDDEEDTTLFMFEENELWNCEDDWMEREGVTKEDIKYAEFGFISGCIWGDDMSWKIQWLDLSDIKNGNLIREKRFGYHELPRNQKLYEAVNIDWWDDWEATIEVNTYERYSVNKENMRLRKYDSSKREWVYADGNND